MAKKKQPATIMPMEDLLDALCKMSKKIYVAKGSPSGFPSPGGYYDRDVARAFKAFNEIEEWLDELQHRESAKRLASRLLKCVSTPPDPNASLA